MKLTLCNTCNSMFVNVLKVGKKLTGFGRGRDGRLGRACGAYPPYFGGRPQPRLADSAAGRGGRRLLSRVGDGGGGGGGRALTHPDITVHWSSEHNHINTLNTRDVYSGHRAIKTKPEKKNTNVCNDCSKWGLKLNLIESVLRMFSPELSLLVSHSRFTLK